MNENILCLIVFITISIIFMVIGITNSIIHGNRLNNILKNIDNDTSEKMFNSIVAMCFSMVLIVIGIIGKLIAICPLAEIL